MKLFLKIGLVVLVLTFAFILLGCENRKVVINGNGDNIIGRDNTDNDSEDADNDNSSSKFLQEQAELDAQFAVDFAGLMSANTNKVDR